MPMGIPRREGTGILGPGKSLVVCRYIDDLYSAGVPLPSQEDYGMEDKTTAKGKSIVYLVVRVYIFLHINVHITSTSLSTQSSTLSTPSTAPKPQLLLPLCLS